MSDAAIGCLLLLSVTLVPAAIGFCLGWWLT